MITYDPGKQLNEDEKRAKFDEIKKGEYCQTIFISKYIDDFKKYVEDEDLMIFSIGNFAMAIKPEDKNAVQKIKEFFSYSYCNSDYGNEKLGLTNIISHGTWCYKDSLTNIFDSYANCWKILNIYLPNIPHYGAFATNGGCKERADKYSKVIKQLFNDSEHDKYFKNNKVYIEGQSYGNFMIANFVKNIAENCDNIEMSVAFLSVAHGFLFFQNYEDIAEVFGNISEEGRKKIKKIFIQQANNMFHSAKKSQKLYDLLKAKYNYEQAILLNEKIVIGDIKYNNETLLCFKYMFDKDIYLKKNKLSGFILCLRDEDNYDIYVSTDSKEQEYDFIYKTNAGGYFLAKKNNFTNGINKSECITRYGGNNFNYKSSEGIKGSYITFDLNENILDFFCTTCKDIEDKLLQNKDNSKCNCCCGGVDVLDDDEVRTNRFNNSNINNQNKEDEKDENEKDKNKEDTKRIPFIYNKGDIQNISNKSSKGSNRSKTEKFVIDFSNKNNNKKEEEESLQNSYEQQLNAIDGYIRQNKKLDYFDFLYNNNNEIKIEHYKENNEDNKKNSKNDQDKEINNKDPKTKSEHNEQNVFNRVI